MTASFATEPGPASRRMAQAVRDAARMVRHGQFELTPPRRIFADPILHRAIMARCDFTGGRFFEAGANDGLAWSNTAYLERNRGWTGVLVEPAPGLVDACRRNRTAETVQAALTGRDGDMVELHYANLMSAIEAPGVDGATHAAEGRCFLPATDPARIIAVPTRTIDSVLEAAAIGPLDLFVLDVERAEFQALAGMDIARWRPCAMLIETREPGRLTAMLMPHGYQLEARLGAQDYLFATTRH